MTLKNQKTINTLYVETNLFNLYKSNLYILIYYISIHWYIGAVQFTGHEKIK